MNAEKSILVTGCSSGIGYGIAQKFIKEGYLVFGTVRKKKDADRLQEELGEQFYPLIMDVTKPNTIKAAVTKVQKKLKGKGLGGLINNAGVALSGPLLHMPMKEMRYMFEVNTFGPLEVTRAFLPLLGMRKNHDGRPGRIINISSNAGQISAPFIGAYCGSKHALEGMTNSLRQELKKYGIEILIVGPGFVNTSIVTNMSEISRYEKTDYIQGLRTFTEMTRVQVVNEAHTIDEAGLLIYDIFHIKNPKTRYAVVKNKFKNRTLLMMMPIKIRDKLVAKIFGL